MYEAHTRLINEGFWTGGRLFGYRNVDVHNGVDVHGRPLRAGVKLEINEEEARVVRHAFELYTSGLGLRAVAKTLNLEGHLTPPSPHYKDGRPVEPGWKVGNVASILDRELYAGVHVWNRSKKRNPVYLNVDPKPRPESEWKRTPWPWCRIIDDELWQAAQQRRKAMRGTRNNLGGRPPKHEVRNLLAGLARCGVCGSGLVVETSGRKDHRIAEYVCRRHRHSPTKKEIEKYIEEHGRVPAVDDLF